MKSFHNNNGTGECLFCYAQASIQHNISEELVSFNCPFCGSYSATNLFLKTNTFAKDEKRRQKICSLVMEWNISKKKPLALIGSGESITPQNTKYHFLSDEDLIKTYPTEPDNIIKRTLSNIRNILLNEEKTVLDPCLIRVENQSSYFFITYNSSQDSVYRAIEHRLERLSQEGYITFSKKNYVFEEGSICHSAWDVKLTKTGISCIKGRLSGESDSSRNDGVGFYGNININNYGSNSRTNINSTDNSINTITSVDPEVFALLHELCSTINQSALSDEEKTEYIDIVIAVEEQIKCAPPRRSVINALLDGLKDFGKKSEVQLLILLLLSEFLPWLLK